MGVDRWSRCACLVAAASFILAVGCSRAPSSAGISTSATTGINGRDAGADGGGDGGGDAVHSGEATPDDSTLTPAGSSPAGSVSSPGARSAGPRVSQPAIRTGSAVGITKDTITISVSIPITSAYGALAEKAYDNAVDVWLREVNANGGIHGRKIVLKKVDNQNTSEGAVAACKEEKSNGSFMVFGLLTLPQEDDCLNAAQIPVINRLASEYKANWTHVLAEYYVPAWAPPMVSFLKSSYVKAGGKKIGIVYTGDQAQSATEYAATSAELRKQGLNLVHSERVTQGQASFVSEMSRMRASGAEVVLMMLVVESPGVLRDANAIGYKPQWIADPLGSGVDALCQAAGPNCAGIRGITLGTRTNDPAYSRYVAKVRKYKGAAAARGADTLDMVLYSSANHLGRLLELAGPNPTRESLLAGARGMTPFDDKMTGPLTFKGRIEGIRALFPFECCNSDGTFKVIGPAREQF